MFYKLTDTWFINSETVALVRISRLPESQFQKDAAAYKIKTGKPMPRAIIYLDSGKDLQVFDADVQQGLIRMLESPDALPSAGKTDVEETPFG